MPREPLAVARRCLCLELLFQRYLLEDGEEDDASERERARALWLSREGDLGLQASFTPGERALMERPVGGLSEDDKDDLHGRMVGAGVLLWALGRLKERPSLASAEASIDEVGLLNDGSIPAARAAAEAASLRDEAELEKACAEYARVRGRARDVDDPERIFAFLAAHHLTWILEDQMGFEDDIEL